MIIDLLLTIIIELPVMLVLFKRKDKMFISVVILINIITNLTLNIILSIFPNLFAIILLLEAIIIFIEAMMYKSFYSLPVSKLLLYSAIANITSYFLGLAIIRMLL